MIRHTGGPARLIFGELDGRRSARLEAFLQACAGAQIDAELSADIRVTLWTKFAFICAQAGLTAATRSPIGVIRDTPATWRLFRQVLEETAATGRAEGVALPEDLVDRGIEFASGLAPTLYSSLNDDLVAGRRIELDALLGELVRRAAGAGFLHPRASPSTRSSSRSRPRSARTDLRLAGSADGVRGCTCPEGARGADRRPNTQRSRPG